MHDIIVATMIRSERDRLDSGATRIEESRPIQSFFRGMFTRTEKTPKKSTTKNRQVSAQQVCVCKTTA